jgi:hypothetical protein
MRLTLTCRSIDAFDGPLEEDRVMNETMMATELTHTGQQGGSFGIVEHVPARVCKETGEELFSCAAATPVQALVKSNRTLGRVMQTPVHPYP